MADERQTVLLADAAGAVTWDELTGDAWPARDGYGRLLRTRRGCWARLDALADLAGQPARVMTDAEALGWLVANGHAVPESLAALAASWRVTATRLESGSARRKA